MPPKDVLDLHICIIGAGMGGLTTALALAKRGFRHIEVFEYASSLGFVGAGIQLAPNMARILDRLGVWTDVEKEAVDVKNTSIRQGSTDEELAYVDLLYIRKTYHYPHMVGHRSNLAESIYKGCQREKAITFHFSTTVEGVESFSPQPIFTARPRNGSMHSVCCDVLVAADGVKSTIREQLLQHQDVSAKIIDTGQAAYRIMLTRDELSHDPELLGLVDADTVTRWIGKQRHIIAYPVSNKHVYNISTVQPDTNFASAPSATYTTKGSKPKMQEVFADFCPKLRRMLDLVPDGEVCEWKLRVHEPLPSWTQDQTALLGDACHPTLPHLAQGAAQAIEDAAVLAVVLSRLSSAEPEVVGRALKVYEKLRMERAYALVELAAASGRSMHLGEGAAKAERDRAFEALRANAKGPVPDRWADAEVQKMIYGTDVVEIAEKEFERLYAELQ